MTDLVERVERLINSLASQYASSGLVRDNAKNIVAIVLEEAAKVADSYADKQDKTVRANAVARAIRALGRDGND